MSTTPERSCSFPCSRTCQNLLHACRIGTGARRLYLQAAEELEGCGLHVAAHAFRFTAAQEKEHAAILRGLLCVYGSAAPQEMTQEQPVPQTPEELLENAVRSETETSRLYPAYARNAQREGYPRIAAALLRIADTEALHARRFAQYLSALQDGSLFRSPEPTAWLCLPCGHLHFGAEAPGRCDACARSQGHFIRSDFHPFTVAP